MLPHDISKVEWDLTAAHATSPLLFRNIERLCRFAVDANRVKTLILRSSSARHAVQTASPPQTFIPKVLCPPPEVDSSCGHHSLNLIVLSMLL
jgi:hypothetical protein